MNDVPLFGVKNFPERDYVVPEMNVKEIGGLVRQARKKQGFTQQEAAGSYQFFKTDQLVKKMV